MPLVYSKLKLADLLSEVDTDQFLRIESDGSLTLVYGDTYTSATAEQILPLDDQSFSETITLEAAQLAVLNSTGEVSVTINRVLDYTFSAFEIDKIWFKKGALDINVNTTLEHDVRIDYTIIEGQQAGNTFTSSAIAEYTSLPNTGSNTSDINLSLIHI